MTRKVGDSLVIRIPVDSDDDMRALYRGLLRACASERSEQARIRSLRGSGYGTEAMGQEQLRLTAQERMLDRLLAEVETEMKLEGVKPW